MLKAIWKVLRTTLGKLGGKDSRDYLLKDNIVILRGKISKEIGSVQITYPGGLNKENCVVLNCLFKPTEKSNWKMGSTFNSGNAFGSLPFDVTLNDNEIIIRIKNIIINNGINPSVIDLTLDYDYKIVLMKLE